ncbi:hypothetical protein GCM10023190_09070 [Enteractinococcus fodinae]
MCDTQPRAPPEVNNECCQLHEADETESKRGQPIVILKRGASQNIFTKQIGPCGNQAHYPGNAAEHVEYGKDEQ